MSNARAWHRSRIPPARLAPLAFAVALAALALTATRAAADDPSRALRSRHVVATHAILTGPRWYFRETTRGDLATRRGDAVTAVFGRDIFAGDARSALTLEAYAGTAFGGRGRTAHAGVSFGVKVRTARRVELSTSIAIVDHFDPDDLRELAIGAGLIAQLAYDLDGGAPFSTRILLRAEIQHPTSTLVTLDTFVGLGTRWP